MLVMLLATGLVAGCNYPGKEFVDQRAQARSLEQSAAKLKQQTPMVVIDSHESTGPGPISVYYGRDQAGKPVAAWIHTGEGVLGHLSLDGGVSQADAQAQIEAAGYKVEWGPVLIGPEKPFWLAQVRDSKQPNVVFFAHVDERTGELTVKENGR